VVQNSMVVQCDVLVDLEKFHIGLNSFQNSHKSNNPIQALSINITTD
jgi:hypothetical protein